MDYGNVHGDNQWIAGNNGFPGPLHVHESTATSRFSKCTIYNYNLVKCFCITPLRIN
jgi:hypothetical protein